MKFLIKILSEKQKVFQQNQEGYFLGFLALNKQNLKGLS